MFTAESILDDTILRVYIDNNTGRVDISSIGMETIDILKEGTYNNIDTLPRWLQERIAVLMLTSGTSTQPTVEVEGVGRRIDANTFWVYTDSWRTT